MDAKRAEDYMHVCNSDFVPPADEREHALEASLRGHGVGRNEPLCGGKGKDGKN